MKGTRSISPKVNVIVQLEIELTHYDVTVQHFSHYTTETHHSDILRVLMVLGLVWFSLFF